MKLGRLALLALATMMISASVAHAGEGADSSGGGNALVCFDNPAIVEAIRAEDGNLLDEHVPHIVSVETYDLYAAKKAYGAESLLPFEVTDASVSGSKSINRYLDVVLRRVGRLVPQLKNAIDLSERLTLLPQIINQPFGLFKVDDVDPTAPFDTKRCVLATMATHYFDNGSYFLHLDRRLYDHPTHSLQSKAVLLLHEQTYMAARRAGQTTSKNTRELIGMMLRKDAGMTARQWIDFAWERGFGANGEKYYGAPGMIAYDAMILLFEAAAAPQLAYYSKTVDPERINFASEALKSLHEDCQSRTVVGCLKTIRRLEQEHRPGVQHLALAKKRLLDALNAKIDNMKFELDRQFNGAVKNAFRKIPYKPLRADLANDDVAQLMFEAASKHIFKLLDERDIIDTTVSEHMSVYEAAARSMAREIDRAYDLDMPPQ